MLNLENNFYYIYLKINIISNKKYKNVPLLKINKLKFLNINNFLTNVIFLINKF